MVEWKVDTRYKLWLIRKRPKPKKRKNPKGVFQQNPIGILLKNPLILIVGDV
jgi:hypothetical protein